MRPTIADQIWSWMLPKRVPYWRNPLRWSEEENDYAIGRVALYSKSKYRPWAIIFTSYGGGEDDDKPANLRVSNPWFGTLIIRLPRWLVPGPTITRVYPPDWTPDSEVVKRLGRNYFEEIDAHEYGFSASNSGTVGDSVHFQLKMGRSTMDSSTDKSWGCFLPWTEWRHIRISYYGLQGELVGTVWDKDHPARSMLLGSGVPGRFDVQREMEKRVPKQSFMFTDFDGEKLKAATFVEEREWRAGAGWFKWLALFRKPIVRRSLSIAFSGETGKRKGSWKGGTIGSGIAMERGPDGEFWEGHLGAFLRYCKENNMMFAGIGDWPVEDLTDIAPKPDGKAT